MYDLGSFFFPRSDTVYIPMASKADTDAARRAQALAIGDRGVRILRIISHLLVFTGFAIAMWGLVSPNLDWQLAMMLFITMFALANHLQIKALGEQLGIGAFSGEEIPDKRSTSDSEE